MISFPPCKINLGLHVLSARLDGYHNIETCFYPVPWCDILEIIPAERVTFTYTGIDIPGDKEDNVCLRTYKMLSNDFNISPVAIHLHKIIPIGAGLGGGSSDAVQTLKMLNRLFALHLTHEDILAYSLRLGSDCAYFTYEEGPMLGAGRGELLSAVQVSLKGKHLVLVYPNIHISSQEAYERVVPRLPDVPLRQLLNEGEITAWKTDLSNDFEVGIFKKYPVIGEIKEKLYNRGAIYAGMSGSGSTVFGIFNSLTPLEDHFPEMKYWSTQL